MERPAKPRITIIGAGNVATSLAPALAQVANIVCIYSRTPDSTNRLASNICNCRPTTSLSEINTDVDFIIVTIPDNETEHIIRLLPHTEAIVAHTSGSVPLQSSCKRNGVFYPLQTFSRQSPIALNNVPFFIEGDSDITCQALETLASNISTNVRRATSTTRATLHLAAVFACNFANQMWAEAENILAQQGCTLNDFALLLTETLNKAMRLTAHKAQTGPAMRRDVNIIDKHLAMLPKPAAHIYQTITQRIIATHKHE